MNPDPMNAFGPMFGTIIATVLIFGAALTIFFVWCFWRIFERAGFSGALGLLCLIPSIGPLVCLVVLAFSTWPTAQVERPPIGGVPMV